MILFPGPGLFTLMNPWFGLNDIKMMACLRDVFGFDCFMPCTTCLDYELTNKSVLVPKT